MGIIFDIKRFAVHDGPGIRTTVFLKGCPLVCAWCHNPESRSGEISTVRKTVCVGDRCFLEKEIVGREISVSELMTELEKERIFMEESGGGVTFSGGEPTFQHKFLNEALIACKKAGMHTAVDTSGYVRWEILEEISKNTDLFLFDLKIMDEELHRQYTGVPNKLIHENLIKLLDMGKSVYIRMPMVQDASFSETNIQQSLDFLSGLSRKPELINLLPFHNTASHKYERFEMENAFSDMKSMDKKELEGIKKQFENAGFQVKIGG